MVNKISVKITVDPDLWYQAEKKGINRSLVCENALIKELDLDTFKKANENQCEICKIPISYPHLEIHDQYSKIKHYCVDHERYAR